MNMKLVNILKEYFKESQSNKETLDDFLKRFENKNSNSIFLRNHFKNPNFRLELLKDGNVKIKKYDCSSPNQCEKNTFVFIKNMIEKNNHRYFPVSGWAFMESTTYFEHFWVYDSMNDIFVDITPMGDDLPYAYGGVINFNINDDIENATKYNEIKFLLGKVGNSLYKDYENNLDKNINNKQKNINNKFDFIFKNPKYEDLKNFIQQNNIENIEDLKKYLYKLKDIQSNVRSNREYNYYENLIQQILNLEL